MAKGESLHSRFDLPGFNLPVDFVPLLPDGQLRREGTHLGEGGVLFRNALCDDDRANGELQLPLTTLREFAMLRLMNIVTDNPEWHVKIFNEAIISKWKIEVLSSVLDFSERMVDWCVAELQYKAKIFSRTGVIGVFTGDVVKSDTAIPLSTQEQLKVAVKSLEDVPAQLKDWHPDSDDKILHLVHPSLFPLVYGTTRILPDSLTNLDDCIKKCGDGIVLPVPPRKVPKHPPTMVPLGAIPVSDPYSKKFQWLPCEVDVSGEDGTKITSYINNLHPKKHTSLYKVIEEIIGHAIPLWNVTLSALKFPDPSLPRIVYTDVVYVPDPESWPETEGLQPDEDEDENEFWDRRQRWIRDTRRIVQPEPKGFEAPVPLGHVDLRRDYSKPGLQVIVKLANIVLTPEKAEYEGGKWHFEGQLNEHICASAIYYYDNDNITPSSLAFRQQSSPEVAKVVNYPQNEDEWLEDIFGCSNWAAAVQHVGSIHTKEGRISTFPNIVQSRVQPFQLADPTKPGHHKILALFLVDPNIRIISTANVPCQRKDWWSEIIRNERGGISDLPVELQDSIFDAVDGFPNTLKEAKRVRRDLMQEREQFVVSHTDAFETKHFALREH